jgi:GNAT superfamily N-acetyltransferase
VPGDLRLLDNVVWHTLATAHARFAIGQGAVRRYQRGFSPIVGFEDQQRPDLTALAGVCEPGEQLYTEGWSGPCPPGWQMTMTSSMFKMIWDDGLPPEEDEAGLVSLTQEHASRALALAELTRPGPFGVRTIELGDYLGIFDGAELIAMAGERFQVEGFREISAVCTRPGYQGRGHARRLMHVLIRRQLRRGETPFLHVVRQNAHAHQLYVRMGFRDYKESAVTVIARTS